MEEFFLETSLASGSRAYYIGPPTITTISLTYIAAQKFCARAQGFRVEGFQP